MSKLNMEVLKEAITKMLTTKKKREFTETVELQAMLKVSSNVLHTIGL